jgi:hypothetical protein
MVNRSMVESTTVSFSQSFFMSSQFDAVKSIDMCRLLPRALV